VLDALMFEERGIPGVALVTTPFRQTGAAMAATWGLPGFHFLDLAHPIAILGDREMDARADELTPLVAALLGAATAG
jgi:hypothetical protein